MELFQQNPMATSAEPPPPNDPQLDAAYRTLDRVVGSVVMADNKALIGLTFQGAIVAGLALIAGPLHTAIGRHRFGIWQMIVFLILAVFFVSLALSTLKLFSTISPRIREDPADDHPSTLFYFGGISAMSLESYMARMRTLDVNDIHDAVATITHANAHIAFQKFKDLRTAFMGLAVQMVLYVFIVVLAVMPSNAL